MDFELSPDQQRIQSLARDFAQDEVAPLAREADEQRRLPSATVGRMAELGFLGGPIAPRVWRRGAGRRLVRARLRRVGAGRLLGTRHR